MICFHDRYLVSCLLFASCTAVTQCRNNANHNVENVYSQEDSKPPLVTIHGLRNIPPAKDDGKEETQVMPLGPRQADSSDETLSSTSTSSIALSNIIRGAISSAVVIVVVPVSSRKTIATTTRERTTTLATFASNSRSIAISTSSSTRTATTNVSSLSPSVMVAPTPSGTREISPGFTPPAPPDEGPLSPFAQLGVSFAVGFGLLSIAAAIAIIIWRRRQAPRHNLARRKPNLSDFAKRIWTRKKNKNTPEDPERRTGSVNSVASTRTMQEESGSTESGLDSRDWDNTSEMETRLVEGQQREMSLALTSNPVTPPPVVARVRFSALPNTATQNSERNTKEVKYRSWPLKG